MSWREPNRKPLRFSWRFLPQLRFVANCLIVITSLFVSLSLSLSLSHLSSLSPSLPSLYPSSLSLSIPLLSLAPCLSFSLSLFYLSLLCPSLSFSLYSSSLSNLSCYLQGTLPTHGYTCIYQPPLKTKVNTLHLYLSYIALFHNSLYIRPLLTWCSHDANPPSFAALS